MVQVFFKVQEKFAFQKLLTKRQNFGKPNRYEVEPLKLQLIILDITVWKKKTYFKLIISIGTFCMKKAKNYA